MCRKPARSMTWPCRRFQVPKTWSIGPPISPRSRMIPDEMAYWFSRPRPIETRPLKVHHRFKPVFEDPPINQLWSRAAAPVPDDQALQQALLTYAVEVWLLDCSTMAHGYQFSDSEMQMASLDHPTWFLRPFRAVTTAEAGLTPGRSAPRCLMRVRSSRRHPADGRQNSGARR